MSDTKHPIDAGAHEASYRPVTHQTVHRRFLSLLARDGDTGIFVSWKNALLEPVNPLKPAKRAALKLPILYALWIAVLAIGGFLWFSFSH
jgi:hypothetical protein